MKITNVIFPHPNSIKSIYTREVYFLNTIQSSVEDIAHQETRQKIKFGLEEKSSFYLDAVKRKDRKKL